MKKWIFFQCCLVAFLITPVFSQSNDPKPKKAVADSTYKSFRLFEDVSPLDITLNFDLTSYLRTKSKEDYLKARITFHISKKDSISKKIKLKTRGFFRNKYCLFSPIELNFSKADFGYSDLNSISKLKMVPECRPGAENENYVLREYLVYKLFNVLTDTSFRVRLLTVKYIDSENKRKPVSQYGFFIEPVEMLAARTNTVQINAKNITQKNIVPKLMDRLAIFDYMIGNYDWSIPGQHNVKVLKSMGLDSAQLGIAIPYDFDWTGLVNADYAIPDEVIGTKTVRERIYEGICRKPEVFLKDLEIFSKKKDEFYRVIDQFPYLKQREKKDITGYLDQFFGEIKGNTILENIERTCKRF